MALLRWILSSLPSPRCISAVAGVTLVQLLRMRIFLVLGGFFVLFLALQFLPFHGQLGVEFSGFNQLALIKDIGSGCLYLFGVLFSVAATSLLIPRDAEDRILYTILSKPVSSFDYLAGKALGVLSLLFLTFLLMDGMMCLALHFREATLALDLRAALAHQGATPEEMLPYLAQLHEAAATMDFQRALLPMALNCVVLTSMTLLLSCLTSGTLVSMIFGLGFFFVGMFQSQFFLALAASTGEAGISPMMQRVADFTALIIPDFSLFSVTDAALSSTVSAQALLSLTGIAFGYFLFHLLISSYIFNRKEF